MRGKVGKERRRELNKIGGKSEIVSGEKREERKRV
jgi:hypothetical protein